MTTFTYHDGGREAAGFRGIAGDCVTRAIAIAAELPYRQVYEELYRRARLTAEIGKARKCARHPAFHNLLSPREGVYREVYEPYLAELGFAWTPTMRIGSGCKVHLKAEELPEGRIICRVTAHVVAMIDGVIYDINDPSRNGTRCVYGYYRRKN